MICGVRYFCVRVTINILVACATLMMLLMGAQGAHAEEGIFAYLGEVRTNSNYASGFTSISNHKPSAYSFTQGRNSNYFFVQEGGPNTASSFYAQDSNSSSNFSWITGSDGKSYTRNSSSDNFATRKPVRGDLGEILEERHEIWHSSEAWAPKVDGEEENPRKRDGELTTRGPTTVAAGGNLLGYHVCKVKRKTIEENSAPGDYKQWTLDIASSTLPKMIITTSEGYRVPDGKQAVLKYTVTWYDICYSCADPQINPSSFSGEIVLRGSGGGSLPAANPGWISGQLPNDTCRVISWPELGVIIRDKPGFRSSSASAAVGHAQNPVTGMWSYNNEMDQTSVVVTPEMALLTARYFAEMAQNNFRKYFLPKLRAEADARFAWLVKLVQVLTQVDPPPPAIPAQCKSYTSVDECIKAHLTPLGEPGAVEVSRIAASPSPSPTPR